jgi:hypothetical protein
VKEHNLLNLSTTVKIMSNPRVEVGKGPIKSIVTCSKGLLGLLKGDNKPYYF